MGQILKEVIFEVIEIGKFQEHWDVIFNTLKIESCQIPEDIQNQLASQIGIEIKSKRQRMLIAGIGWGTLLILMFGTNWVGRVVALLFGDNWLNRLIEVCNEFFTNNIY